jgi:hypothetical protein
MGAGGWVRGWVNVWVDAGVWTRVCGCVWVRVGACGCVLVCVAGCAWGDEVRRYLHVHAVHAHVACYMLPTRMRMGWMSYLHVSCSALPLYMLHVAPGCMRRVWGTCNTDAVPWVSACAPWFQSCPNTRPSQRPTRTCLHRPSFFCTWRLHTPSLRHRQVPCNRATRHRAHRSTSMSWRPLAYSLRVTGTGKTPSGRLGKKNKKRRLQLRRPSSLKMPWPSRPKSSPPTAHGILTGHTGARHTRHTRHATPNMTGGRARKHGGGVS